MLSFCSTRQFIRLDFPTLGKPTSATVPARVPASVAIGGKLPGGWRNGNGISAPLDWGFIAPTESFLAEFEANDPRLLYTVRVSDKAVYKLLGATNTAYKGNDDAPGNKVFIRFADVLLWKAEAYNETGNQAQAIVLINRASRRQCAGSRTGPSYGRGRCPGTRRPCATRRSGTARR
jgi:hypothetical protein